MLNNLFNVHSEIIKNFFWRALQISGKQGITFIIFILCAKLLSIEDFGSLNYLLAIIYLLVIFSDFGISTSASKYIAEYDVKNYNKAKTILFSSLVIILIASIIISIISILFGKYIYKDYYSYILYLLPLVFLIPITGLYDGLYRGLNKFKELSIISLSTGLISLGLIYLLIIHYGLVGAILAQNTFYIILFILLAFFYRNFEYKVDMVVFRQILNYSIIIGIANTGYFLYTRIDILILGQFGLIEEIGYYEIVIKLFQITLIPAMILGQIISPNITRDFASGKMLIVKQKFYRTSIFMFVSGLFIALIIYYICPYIFKIVLPEYNTAILIQVCSLILLLVPLRFFSTPMNIGFITAIGMAKILMISTLIFGISNFLLNYILIIHFGFIGVIYATIITQFCFIIFNLFFFNKSINELIRNEVSTN